MSRSRARELAAIAFVMGLAVMSTFALALDNEREGALASALSAAICFWLALKCYSKGARR